METFDDEGKCPGSCETDRDCRSVNKGICSIFCDYVKKHCHVWQVNLNRKKILLSVTFNICAINYYYVSNAFLSSILKYQVIFTN
jgi:hypothetical protein